jgi:hypothetical protein
VGVPPMPVLKAKGGAEAPLADASFEEEIG